MKVVELPSRLGNALDSYFYYEIGLIYKLSGLCFLSVMLWSVQRLCDYVCDLLLEESNVQPVSTPVTVCGDIHGQVKMESQNTLITDVSKQHVYTDS